DEVDVVDSLPTSPLVVARSPKSRTSTHTNSNLPGAHIDEKEVAEELPTNPHMTSLSLNPPLSHVSSSSDFGNGVMSHDQIEDIATRPYAAQPRTISHEIEKPIYKQRQAMQAPTGSMYSPVLQRPVTPVPIPQSQFPPAQPVRQTPPVSMPVSPLAKPKKNNRKRFAIVFGLLFILLLGGVFAWVIVSQPFAVPE